MSAGTSLAILRRRWHGLAPNARGALWILLSGLLFTAMATIMKALGARLDSFQIAFFRSLFGFVVILPFALRSGSGIVKTRRLPLHLARGLLGAFAMLCMVYAITHLMLADAVAIGYTRPLFLIVLAVLFLGETVRLRRWTATAVGFVGVLIMMRPAGALETAALVALLGAFLIAVINVLVKKLAETERPLTILVYFGVISTVATFVPALTVWQAPTPGELALLVLVGVFGAGAHTCNIHGLRLGEATAVMPFDYARLLFAGAIGFLLFAEVPDLWTLAGALVIAGSTLYIAIREARLGKGAGLGGGEPDAYAPAPDASDAPEGRAR